MTNEKTHHYEVSNPLEEGTRIDKWLSQFEELGSRTAVIELIDSGKVTLDGRVLTKSSEKVFVGMKISVTQPEKAPLNLVANFNHLEIEHEDQDLIVINKPAGLVVHPSAGHLEDSLVHRLLGHCQLSNVGIEERPGVVHRLDRDTSGLIVMAKNERAHRHLALQFKNKTTHRVYEAICYGVLSKSIGSVSSYLNRHPVDRKKRSSVRDVNKKIIDHWMPDFEKGKWAVTHYKELAQHISGQLSLVELKLETGRTHQIRVHLTEMGHPLVGDSLYGADRRLPRLKGAELKQLITPLRRVLLHARELGFTHPVTGQELQFRRDWPTDILELRNQLFFSK